MSFHIGHTYNRNIEYDDVYHCQLFIVLYLPCSFIFGVSLCVSAVHRRAVCKYRMLSHSRHIFFFVCKKEAKNTSALEIWLHFQPRFRPHLNSLRSNRKCVFSEARLKILHAKFLRPKRESKRRFFQFFIRANSRDSWPNF